jgi:hypothetical protein
MSVLSHMLRRVTGGRWPRRRLPRLDRPHFDCFKRLGAVPGMASASGQPRSATELCIEEFFSAPCFLNRLDHLRHAFELAPAEGHILEFGVFRGGSLNWLARWSQQRRWPRVFGFDSFEGLPEPWVRTKSGLRYDRGHFAVSRLPAVLPNTELVAGFFDQTLPGWLTSHAGPVALLHNDSDLYSSTIYTLTQLNERIVPGTIIVFDELCDWRSCGEYDAWEEGEWKALREWMAAENRQIEVLSRNQEYAAAVRVVK